MSTNEFSSPPIPGDEVIVAEVTTVTFSDQQADQVAGTVGRNWGILLGLGIILTGLGVAVLVWPQATIGVLAVLLGIALLVSGIFGVIGAITRGDHPTSLRVLGGISGVLSIVLGGIALMGITEAVTILALMVGFGWIVRGIAELAAGISAKGQPGRGLLITVGILGLFAGVAVLVWPSITLVALAYVTGISIILFGILQMLLAFRVRNVRTAEDLQHVIAG